MVYRVRSIEPEALELPDAKYLPEVFEWYLSEQQDPMIGAKTGTCTFSMSEGTWRMNSTFPISMDFPTDTSLVDFDWNSVTESEAQTNALWKYSIGYLPALLEQSEDFELITFVLESLWDFTQTDEWTTRAKWMTSLDHCLAVRIRALCALYVEYTVNSQPYPDSLINLLANDVLNLLGNEKFYFPVNNHGAMAAIALVHVCGIFPEFTKWIEKKVELDVLQFALSQLNGIIVNIFDEFGIPNENSPAYHRFWVVLLAPVSTLFEVLPPLYNSSKSDLDIDVLSSLLNKVTHSLRMFSDTSGKLIPIGDTHPSYLEDSSFPEETLITEKNGFAIYKSNKLVLTVNGGSVNYAHKHCDDSSITLSFEGQNLILDAGYYSHDWNDPKAIHTKSQSAHSGLFLTALDNLHPGKLYWPGRERIRASLAQVSTDIFHVRTTVCIDQCVKLEREVLLQSSNQIEINDSIYGNYSEFGSVVRRFLLPLDAQVRIERGYAELITDDIRLEFFYTEPAELVSLSSAQTVPELKGWVAGTANNLSPAKCLEIPITGTTETTRIRFKKLTKFS
ncbi:heparinase II/III domain-containing protein [Corynebacterium stationis]|uniref:heparinase II/III domain-containing protein n=1 Tax=Corynebacterium stationis TaxID=1705 RepID=UPI0009F85AD6|nr:heparinase II/III family protein [Corynebacterium stationis]